LQVYTEHRQNTQPTASPSKPQNQPPKTSTPASTPASTQPTASATAQPALKTTANGYSILQNARLEPDRNNDGDSFKINHQNTIHEVRLHFVDAPEKRLHQYNGERIDHQSRYFGHSNRQTTIEIGLQAQELVTQLLTTRPFTVYTRWKTVFDSDRIYAFVFFEDSGEELSEILVKEGLARIYTEGADLPDGRKNAAFNKHLRSLEAEARRSGRGAWASSKPGT
jgi:endonuclease YncB( thermonuclease family)